MRIAEREGCEPGCTCKKDRMLEGDRKHPRTEEKWSDEVKVKEFWGQAEFQGEFLPSYIVDQFPRGISNTKCISFLMVVCSFAYSNIKDSW